MVQLLSTHIVGLVYIMGYRRIFRYDGFAGLVNGVVLAHFFPYGGTSTKAPTHKNILFLSLSCLESWCFSATFREILLPSSGKVCECVSGIMCSQRIEIF